ncbi:cysteine--tRNA ligase [Nitrosomonas sp.]|uniref:cysteine--tRNA ligase n=1 Tax=Nitrosomonas sp. TaxID=42353 RepID=UPI0025DF10E9|nr:cysteine--tRNA ligase [Nitrosomonas sp.]MCC6916545.1 cysteine--tRNA ligase [Nitrosomonas sp.]
MLKIYDTLTRSKREFIPVIPGKVGMYVCGMTVYDHCHLGHARVLVVFDSVMRWLQTLGYKVTYVRNITDIDDKIIRRALENHEPFDALTARYIQAMEEDAAALGVISPSFEPRATRYIDSMIAMIESLLSKGLAYVAGNGDVFYDVRHFSDYGKLSGKSLDDLRAGERVEIDTNKRDPLDFVLWKAAKPDEPSWDSPWGKGRPGWHIECSAMSDHYLGEQFDIHGGGQDLQFPHHENEIAQSEGVHGHSHVNYWMHNGFVRVDNEKMSKSLGNFFTVREILARYQPEVVRFFIVRAHYRSPLNYSDAHLDDARNALGRLYTVLKNHTSPDSEIMTASIDWENDDYARRFMSAMNDDFNTPEAVAVLFDLASEANRTGDARYAEMLKMLGGILGLLQQSPQHYLQQSAFQQDSRYTAEEIENMIQLRLQARKEKNFAQADTLRQQLAEAGIVLEDGPQGTTWRRQ